MSNPHGFQFEHASGCLIARISGRDLITQKEAVFKAVANAVAQQPVKALLVDLRGVDGPYTFMDRYQLGELTARHLANIPVGALVLEKQADPQRIGKLVAVNRGASVEVFIEEAAAYAWLKNYQQAGPS